MKNITTIILFSVLAFASLNAKAQGNLQFNRAFSEMIVDTAIRKLDGIVYDSLTVDSGKVLKITSVNCHVDAGMGGESNLVVGLRIRLNNILISPYHACLTCDISRPQMPIWLPEGTYIIDTRQQNNVSSSYPVNAVISGIEFNLVQ